MTKKPHPMEDPEMQRRRAEASSAPRNAAAARSRQVVNEDLDEDEERDYNENKVGQAVQGRTTRHDIYPGCKFFIESEEKGSPRPIRMVRCREEKSGGKERTLRVVFRPFPTLAASGRPFPMLRAKKGYEPSRWYYNLPVAENIGIATKAKISLIMADPFSPTFEREMAEHPFQQLFAAFVRAGGKRKDEGSASKLPLELQRYWDRGSKQLGLYNDAWGRFAGTKPAEKFFVQGLTYEADGETPYAKTGVPLGATTQDNVQLLTLTSINGKELKCLATLPTKDCTDTYCDGNFDLACKGGDITSPDSGRFVYVYDIADRNQRVPGIVELSTDEKLDYKVVFSKDSLTGNVKNIGVHPEYVFSRSEKTSAVLDLETDLQDLVVPWSRIFNVAEREEVLEWIAAAFAPDRRILDFGWADFRANFTAEVKKILSSAVSVPVESTKPSVEDGFQDDGGIPEAKTRGGQQDLDEDEPMVQPRKRPPQQHAPQHRKPAPAASVEQSAEEWADEAINGPGGSAAADEEEDVAETEEADVAEAAQSFAADVEDVEDDAADADPEFDEEVDYETEPPVKPAKTAQQRMADAKKAAAVPKGQPPRQLPKR